MAWERQVTIKSVQEIEIMREAGRINAEALAAARAAVRPGVTTADINAAAEEVMHKYGVYSPFKGYPGPYPYPASTNVSVNEELVHGIPGKRQLKEGDIVSVDSGVVYEGYVADAAITVAVGHISEQAQRLMDATEGALQAGIAKAVPGNRLGDVSAAVQEYAESRGFYVVRDYTGHGVGRQMHEGPAVPNYGKPGTGMLLRAGLVLAIEPMLIVGTEETDVLEDEWTVISADHSLSGHFEHTVAITENGPLVLTTL